LSKKGDALTVLSIGDLVVDIVVSIPSLPVEAGGHQLASQIRLEPGGAGNFLIAGARLGMEMVALGAIGDDPLGSSMLDVLVQEGIHTAGIVQQPDTNSTTVIVLVDAAGKHVFLGGYGEGPAVDIPGSWIAAVETAQAVFALGYTLQEQRIAEAALQAMKRAHEIGIPVFFDPGPEMVKTTPDQITRVLETSKVILLTEEEIPLMTGGAGGLEAARGLLSLGPHLICVKRGPRGCVLFTDGDTIVHPGYPVVVKDTAAAGDSFAAAFIYAYLNGWSMGDLAAFANAMGAAKVRKVGSGTQVPTADDVREVLKTFQVGIVF
jgi:sugar/nucleoside kinase (ribokinase family)